MKLKTLNIDGEIELMDYTDKEVKWIIIESNSYQLEVIHQYGDDYGGSQVTDERETTYEDILPERLLVKDGHFCGVDLLGVYDFYNGGGEVKYIEAQLLVDGSGDTSVRLGYSFSNGENDHWNYWDYRLVDRKE